MAGKGGGGREFWNNGGLFAVLFPSFSLSAAWPGDGNLHHFCRCSPGQLGGPHPHLCMGVEPFAFVVLDYCCFL